VKNYTEDGQAFCQIEIPQASWRIFDPLAEQKEIIFLFQ
jgi:hypothetical protein